MRRQSGRSGVWPQARGRRGLQEAGRTTLPPGDCRGPALQAPGSQTSGLSTGRGYISTVPSLPSLGAQDMKPVLHRQSMGSVTQLGCTWEGSPRRP